jgi:hypothetical protein
MANILTQNYFQIVLVVNGCDPLTSSKFNEDIISFTKTVKLAQDSGKMNQ